MQYGEGSLLEADLKYAYDWRLEKCGYDEGGTERDNRVAQKHGKYHGIVQMYGAAHVRRTDEHDDRVDEIGTVGETRQGPEYAIR